MGGGAPGAGSENGNMLSLNFFRMFRFGSQPAPPNAQGESTGRMVPVIIVGIRSVTPRDSGDTDERPTPFLDALTANIPMAMPGVERRSRLRNAARRASTSDAEMPARPSRTSDLETTSSTNVDGTRVSEDTPRSLSTILDDAVNNEEDPLEAYRNRRESIRRRFPRRLSTSESQNTETPFPHSSTDRESRATEGPPRTRDSRRRTTPSNMEGTRSWIIYVLGGSYPENHPILTTPSLFTDVSCTKPSEVVFTD